MENFEWVENNEMWARLRATYPNQMRRAEATGGVLCVDVDTDTSADFDIGGEG